MEKLEHILRAEEEAREALDDARARLVAIKRDAAAEAGRMTASAEKEAAHEATALRTRILDKADAGIVAIEREEETKLSSLLSGAESRVSDAVEAVLRELTG